MSREFEDIAAAMARARRAAADAVEPSRTDPPPGEDAGVEGGSVTPESGVAIPATEPQGQELNDEDAREIDLQSSITSSVNKVTWAQVGRVTEPGRHMFRFGWLTVTADDLLIWEQFPNAAFALVKTQSVGVYDEFRLGTFELRENVSVSEK
jgi:hypothetical protein